MAMGLFLLTSCQEKQSQETVVEDGTIPVSTTSDEALENYHKGLAYFDEGYGQKARPLFDKALEQDPDFVSAQMYRAFSANSAGDWGTNRDKFLAMRDKANEAERLLMDYVEAGKVDDADKELQALKMLADKFPNSARAQVFLGSEYEGREEYTKCRTYYENALKLKEDFLPAINSLGFSYMFSEPVDYEKSEKYMAKAAELLPNSSKTHINLGDAYRAQNKLENALSSYIRAAELDPEDEVALSKAGHANSFLGNYKAARKNYKDCQAISEFGTGGMAFTAFTYLYESGDYQKTLDVLAENNKKVSTMDIPESNKTGFSNATHFFSAMISMHNEDASGLRTIVESWRPVAIKIAKEVDSEAQLTYAQADLQYWEAVAMALEGDYSGAISKADDIVTTLESVSDPHKLRPYHRVHALVNYKQQNYEKALEHLSHMDESNIYDKYWTAKANMELGNTEKALDMFTELSTYNFNGVPYALIRNEVIAILESQNV